MDLNAILDNGPPIIILILFLLPIGMVLLRRRPKEGARGKAWIGPSVIALAAALIIFFVQFVSDGYQQEKQLRREIQTIEQVKAAAQGDLYGALKLLEASSQACAYQLDQKGWADMLHFETPEPCVIMRRRNNEILRRGEAR